MIKFSKACCQGETHFDQQQQQISDHVPEYKLEASVDILKLFSEINDIVQVEEKNFDNRLRGRRQNIGSGLYSPFFGTTDSPANNCYQSSPTIIFPDNLIERDIQSMPDTDGGSVSSFLSPLSSNNTIAFMSATTVGGQEGGKNISVSEESAKSGMV